jgi:hypothetical protein
VRLRVLIFVAGGYEGMWSRFGKLDLVFARCYGGVCEAACPVTLVWDFFSGICCLRQSFKIGL